MKTSTVRLSFLALAAFFIMSGALFAQDIQQLPTPDRMGSSLGVSGGGDGPPPGSILVGGVPAGSSSKPVLVFIHGYQGSANTWLPEGDNDMYTRAYNDGYRTAFVSVYEDKSMWTNGQLFRDQLASITNYYGVNRVVVVAHSKGGLDTDAAVVHYGAYTDVERVITLGSPHYGSPLADLAQSGWTSWLGAIFGQFNDATYVMQTGYMNYFRSQTDNHPNRPNTAFRTLGGWDWDSFSTLGPSGSYLSSIGFSYFWGGGGNDGVVPYNYSRRPNSTELYSSGSSRTKYDHFELSEGPNVWTTIRGQLPSSLARAEQAPTAETANDYFVTDQVGSQFMVLASEGGAVEFSIDEGATRATVEIRTMDEIGMPGLMNAAQRPVSMKLEQDNSATEGLLGRFVNQYSIEQPTAGKYSLSIDQPYVALVTVEDGGKALLDTDLEGLRQVYRAGETMKLTLKLDDSEGAGINGATITANVRHTGTLQGPATEALSFPVVFKATQEAGVYEAVSPALPTTGVFNISIDAIKGNYHRSITKSVGVVEDQFATALSADNAFDLYNYPNPFTNSTTIRFTLEGSEDLSLKVIDVMGREVRTFDLGNYGEGSHSITWDGTNATGAPMPTGTYFLRMEGSNRAQTERIQIIR